MKHAVNLQDKAVLVILNCSFSWGTVTDKRMTEEITTDKHAATGSIRVRKTLMPAASGALVDAVKSTLASFYQYHLSRTFGTSVVGQRVMPSAFGMEYLEKFGEAEAAGRNALAALEAGYEDAIDEAEKLLGSGFNRDDYPPVEEIKRYYNFERRFLPVPKGDNIMNALGAAASADVDAFVDEIMATAAEDAKKRLREAVKRMADVLTADKAKIYDSMPRAINELAETLPELAGLANDPQLKAMIKEVKANLTGFEAKDFKGDANAATRTAVGKQALELLKKMGG